MGYSPVALESEGSNCFSITPLVEHKVNKCNWKKYSFGGKNERKTGEFRKNIFVPKEAIVYLSYSCTLLFRLQGKQNKAWNSR